MPTKCAACHRELSQSELSHSSTTPDTTRTLIWLCPEGTCYIYWRGYLAGWEKAVEAVQNAFRQPSSTTPLTRS